MHVRSDWRETIRHAPRLRTAGDPRARPLAHHEQRLGAQEVVGREDCRAADREEACELALRR